MNLNLNKKPFAPVSDFFLYMCCTQILTRAIVGEMIQAIKFKCELAEPNYMTIVLLILQVCASFCLCTFQFKDAAG